jgi:hypothetical protein
VCPRTGGYIRTTGADWDLQIESAGQENQTIQFVLMPTGTNQTVHMDGWMDDVIDELPALKT